MNYIEKILEGLRRDPSRVMLQEAWDERVERVTCSELLALVATARTCLRRLGARKGDRCALLGNNSIHWVAMDVAILAEGVVKVPLYARQKTDELVKMMQDCTPSLVFCGDEALRHGLRQKWPDSAPIHLLSDVFSGTVGSGSGTGERAAVQPHEPAVALAAEDPVTIMYTSGTSGDSKGVVLNVRNLDFMLPCTMSRLDDLMQGFSGQERVFHYLPFCFTGSWILLLTSLTRCSLLTMSTDLDKLAAQMAVAKPHYFLNVPILLDRIRSGVDAKMQTRGGPVAALYDKAKVAWDRKQSTATRGFDGFWSRLADAIIFKQVRKKISPNLKALICGSAPLSKDTQLFFEMMGIPVLQVYGLTETTAICTMDRPQGPRQPGRVGFPVSGIEMRLGDNDEILVSGPNVFAGYWKRPADSADCMQGDWFRTGDQGEVDSSGNWRIIGRVKNVLVLSSGHNVAPDPIEEQLKQTLPNAEQVLVLGHERKHLTVILTGNVQRQQADAALARVNATLPHYKQVRAYHIRREPFTIDDGFLTANGKLKRQLVLRAHAAEVEAMYDATAPTAKA